MFQLNNEIIQINSYINKCIFFIYFIYSFNHWINSIFSIEYWIGKEFYDLTFEK